VNTYVPDAGKEREHGTNLSRLDLLEFWGKYINVTRRLQFAPPSRDGAYLHVHEIREMQERLGGPEDDATNEFTARMLLILESRPICNPDTYDSLVGQILDFYLGDLHDHPLNFKPTFLMNDIIRYWKTMCLNYEYARRQKQLDMDKTESPEEKRRMQADIRLKHLKLKFSRLLICYSMIIPLAANSTTPRETIRTLVSLTPTQRLGQMEVASEVRPHIASALDLYEQFLILVARPEIRDEILAPEFRQEQLDRAQQFSQEIFTLLQKTADPNMFRFVVI